jgi:hypothetical protein
VVPLTRALLGLPLRELGTVTQILAALTHEYVLVASDRRLTIPNGLHKGETADDNTCKLVVLCGVWGIA